MPENFDEYESAFVSLSTIAEQNIIMTTDYGASPILVMALSGVELEIIFPRVILGGSKFKLVLRVTFRIKNTSSSVKYDNFLTIRTFNHGRDTPHIFILCSQH